MLGAFSTGIYYWVSSNNKEVKRRWVAILYCLLCGQFVDTGILIYRTKGVRFLLLWVSLFSFSPSLLSSLLHPILLPLSPGSWDAMQAPITSHDIVHLTTFNTISVLRAIFESLPQLILQGYILLVQQQKTSYIVVLSFLGPIVSLAWCLAAYLSKIAQNEFDSFLFAFLPILVISPYLHFLLLYCIIPLLFSLFFISPPPPLSPPVSSMMMRRWTPIYSSRSVSSSTPSWLWSLLFSASV